MYRNHLWVATFAATAVTLVGVTGCQQQSNSASRAATAHAKPTPQESFELIVETFRRGVEDIPIGFVLREESGHTMMTGRNEVSHEVLPPSAEGEPYRAIITVGSKSSYSIQRSNDDAEDEENNSQEGSSGGGAEEEGTELYDAGLVSASKDGSKGRRSVSPDTTVTRKADEQERKYELVYEDGKWRLLTKLDPETEQSIQSAFDHALSTQI